MEKYFKDLAAWQDSFFCNECGNNGVNDFNYDRTVASGEVWHCKRCQTETIVSEEPNEDNY